MLKRLPWRPIAAFTILILTVVVFIQFFIANPSVWQQLGEIPRTTLVLLLGLYFLFTGSLALVNTATLKLCRYSMRAGESLLLTMYSSVINFFGPLQSGPAFRAVYVNKLHDIKVKDYTVASFVYYFFYASYSVLLLFSGVLGWWLVPISFASLALIIGLRQNKNTKLKKFDTLALEHWHYMAIATLVQVSLLTIIFWIELNAVSADVSFSQVAAYTGAANLALFVSFTPGAIGFREAFLVFSERLHHVSNASIVAANTIDRAVYVLMLIFLAVIIVAVHGRKRLLVDKVKS